MGDWADDVYLSQDGTWSASDAFIGQFFHYGDLAPGASYTAQFNVEIPGVLPGSYYLIVRTDALENERDADRSNNQLTSTDTINVSIPTLTLGQTITPTLGSPGDLYYQFTAQAGQTIDITGSVPSPTTKYEFFLRYGAPPTFDQFDQESPFTFDTQQQLSIRDAQQGTYYVLFHELSSLSGATPLQIASKIETFEVDSVSPALGSNVGDATVTITGAEFTPGAVVSLVGSDDTTRTASQVLWRNSDTLWATFDLVGLATGTYGVSVADGGQTVTDPGSFTVTNGAAGSISVHLLVPDSVRFNQGTVSFGEAEVVYTNPGDTDVAAPLLSLYGSTSTNDIVELRLPGQTSFGGNSVQFLALNPDGPSGIIPPRSSFTYTIDFSFSETSLVTSTAIDWAIGEALPTAAIDWASLESSLQPAAIPTDAWDAIYTNFTSQVGGSWGQFQTTLDDDATFLSQLGPVPYDLPSLLSYALQQADDTLPMPILTSATDVSDQEPGLELVFDRSFLQPISGRYSFGPIGLGWAVSWFSSLTPDAQGNVTIQDDGTTSIFSHQSNGSYFGEPGDYDTLTLNQGQYSLQETDGTVTVYNASGTLDYVQDTNGNRITAVYTGNQLTSLVDSDGDAITIAYNDQGLISQVTDAFGQVTTYGYDASDEHLVSVTGPGGTTTYEYSTATSGPTAKELLEIGNPDGTHEYFTYDASGRLIGQSLDGVAEAVSYTYVGPGGVAVTDANSATTTLLFNAAGQVGEEVDALGNAYQFGYDANNNLTTLVEPGGLTYTYSYDSNGNLTSTTNPLGQTVNLAYDPIDNQLASLTDANGNTTNYSYNSQGDLLSITYPGGTGEQFSYDPLGNLTETIDGNGDAINYAYNTQGLVTQETFADGSAISYAYDSRQNLISATDSSGTTTMSYNSADELTEIAYPTGIFLEFTYNAGGQRIQSVDQTGFTVNYSYKAAGQLSELTDGQRQFDRRVHVQPGRRARPQGHGQRDVHNLYI